VGGNQIDRASKSRARRDCLGMFCGFGYNSFCKADELASAGLSETDLDVLLSAMPCPSMFAAGGGRVSAGLDKVLSSAGFEIGLVLLSYSRADRALPDYFVVDVEVIGSHMLGGGGVIIASKSGKLFSGVQANFGSPGATSSVRAGFVDGGPYTGKEVDAFLTGWSASASLTVSHTSWAVSTNLSGAPMYAYETGFARGVPLAVSVSGTYVLGDAAFPAPGWGS